MLWEHGAAGSNPAIPTILPLSHSLASELVSLNQLLWVLHESDANNSRAGVVKLGETFLLTYLGALSHKEFWAFGRAVMHLAFNQD